MLQTIQVELHRDWVDYATVLFSALTGVAALVGLVIANRGTKKANANTAEVLASLRGNLGPTDRLLRLMAFQGIAERLKDVWRRERETPTRWERDIELSQRELALLPEDALPKLRDLVDSAVGYFARAVTNPRRWEDTNGAELVEELDVYTQSLDDQIHRLNQAEPSAAGGLFQSL